MVGERLVMGCIVCAEPPADSTDALAMGVVLVADTTKLVPTLLIGKVGTWASDVEGMLKGRPNGSNMRYRD